MNKIFIGIDPHKNYITYCVLKANGEEFEVGRIATKTRKKIVEFVEKWHEPDNPVCSKSYRHTESLAEAAR